MFKEKGYDAYLAQKVKKGLEDIEQGRVYSLEEANAEFLQTIVKVQNNANKREKIGGKTKDDIYQKLQRLGY